MPHRVLVLLLRAFGERVMLPLEPPRQRPRRRVCATFGHAAGASALSSIGRTTTSCRARARHAPPGQQRTEASFSVLHPDAADYATAAAKSNALSCVPRGSAGRAALVAFAVIETAQGAAAAPLRSKPTCCWFRTMAARPRPAPRFWTRCSRAPRWCRRATATALATLHPRCCSATPNARCPWWSRPAAVRRSGLPPVRMWWSVNATRAPLLAAHGA